jgi:hypothetical protein
MRVFWRFNAPKEGVTKLVVGCRGKYRRVDAGLWPEGPGKHSPGLNGANLMRLPMGEWLLSRRDSTIVARHEVPG